MDDYDNDRDFSWGSDEDGLNKKSGETQSAVMGFETDDDFAAYAEAQEEEYSHSRHLRGLADYYGWDPDSGESADDYLDNM